MSFNAQLKLFLLLIFAINPLSFHAVGSVFEDDIPQEIELRIGFDGTESFDANDEPGNDSGPNNGIVRSNDLMGFDWFYNTDIGGARILFCAVCCLKVLIGKHCLSRLLDP